MGLVAIATALPAGFFCFRSSSPSKIYFNYMTVIGGDERGTTPTIDRPLARHLAVARRTMRPRCA